MNNGYDDLKLRKNSSSIRYVTNNNSANKNKTSTSNHAEVLKEELETSYYTDEEKKYEPRRWRDIYIYIKIEKLNGYRPVASEDGELHPYRKDCMQNPGHEDAIIPETEVELRRLDALVYREYLDPNNTVPNKTPLVSADINELRLERTLRKEVRTN